MKLTTAAQLSAPTRDEIALLAYLNWEKSGKPANSADRFWIEAEAQLHDARAQAAELAAESSHQWPPVRSKTITPIKQKKLSHKRSTSLRTTKLSPSRKHKLVTKNR